MQNLKNQLEQVFNLISTIPVTGDAVERMALAKAKLRELYQNAEEEKTDG